MNFGFWEILLIVLLVFVLFGAKKFPSMMKNLADGIKVFKKEIKTTDSNKSDAKKVATKKRLVKKTVVKKSVAK